MFLVYIEAIGDGFLVVVIAIKQFSAGGDTSVQILLRGKMNIEHLAGNGTGAAAGQTFAQDLHIDIEKQNRVQRFFDFRQQPSQVLRLRSVARKSIEDEPVARIILFQAPFDYLQHQSICNQSAGIHIGLGPQAQRAFRFQFRAQQISGRNLRNTMTSNQFLRLRTLA